MKTSQPKLIKRHTVIGKVRDIVSFLQLRDKRHRLFSFATSTFHLRALMELKWCSCKIDYMFLNPLFSFYVTIKINTEAPA